MAQRRSRSSAHDLRSPRERVLSIAALFAMAGLVVFVLVLLFPERALIAQLRRESLDDPLSASYLANLLASAPHDHELRLLLAESQWALRRVNEARQTLAVLVRSAEQPAPGRGAIEPALQRRVQSLQLQILQHGVDAAVPGSAEAQQRRLALAQGLAERLGDPGLSSAELLHFARQAAAQDDAALARRFYARLAEQHAGTLDEWFDEALRSAIGTQQYQVAAQLHERAMARADAAGRRHHLEAALRILQSGNQLDAALALADAHAGIVDADLGLLMLATRLALAANRLPRAEAYARRLIRMRPAPAAALAPLAQLLSRLSDLLVSPAHAAEEGPALAFEDAAYTLAFETFLANRNIADAYRVAAAAVRQAGHAVRWRERLAQTAEWNGQPQEALLQWRWLAERGGAAGAAAALAAVQRLAAALNDDDVLLWAWQQIQRQRRLLPREVLDIVALHERLGRAGEAADWLEQHEAKHPDDSLLEALAALQERARDSAAAIRSHERLIARVGTSAARALALASLHALEGRYENAYASLAAASALAKPADADYWRLLADLAWALQKEPEALHALRMREAGAGFDSEDANRLLALLRRLQPGEAARFAQSAWLRLGLAHQMIAALSIWWEQGELAQLDRAFDGLTPEQVQRLGAEPHFWMLRAHWAQARGKGAAARADLRHLAVLLPTPSTRSALVFLLIEQGERQVLQSELLRHASAAAADSAYDAAWAAGWHTLGLPRRALPFWRRQWPLRRDDAMWLAAYAELLDAVGQVQSGWDVRRRAWRQLRERLATGGPTVRRAPLMLQAARMALVQAPGDATLALVRELLRLPPGASAAGGQPAVDPAVPAAVQELVMAWGLSTERHEQARRWLWQRYARTLVLPAWIEVSQALAERNTEALARVLDREGATLPAGLRAQAERAAGRRAAALSTAFEALQQQDDDALHTHLAEDAWRDARQLKLSLATPGTGLRGHRLTLGGQLALGDSVRLHAGWEQTRQHSAEPSQLRSVPAGDQALQFGVSLGDQTARLDLALGARRAAARFARARAGLSAQVLETLALKADVAWRADAPDSAALQVAALRHHLQLSAEHAAGGGLTLGLAAQWSRYALQRGGALGRGEGVDATARLALRRGEPELALRAFFTHRQFRAAEGALPAHAAGLVPAGAAAAPATLLPRSHGLVGLGVVAGASEGEQHRRRWQPMVDLALTRHSRNGNGLALAAGLAGPVLGSDRLALRLGAVRAGASGDAQTVALEYRAAF